MQFGNRFFPYNKKGGKDKEFPSTTDKHRRQRFLIEGTGVRGVPDVTILMQWRQGMMEKRFLSTDIDSSKESQWNKLKERSLHLIHRELKDEQQLHDDAAVAVLNDYDNMGPAEFLQQLLTFSLVLDTLKHSSVFYQIQTHLANLLRKGVHNVSGQALDAISVRRDAIQMDVDGKSTLIGSVDNEFLTILSLGKESRETQLQLMAVGKLVEQRNTESLQAVSAAFKIPIYDTGKITLLIDKLFDGQGNFIRRRFEPMVDELARYENHAFELLWSYFKAVRGRVNRIAFLNALQHLISRINRPKHALRFLLSDFCRNPDEVQPSDRNAIMLSNILLRTYNKELDVDIEMTPEEVLNVRNGLDKDVVHYAKFRIDSVEYRFTAKVRAIHEELVERLHATAPDSQAPSIRHLLFLEREIYIFLSLLSGKTAHRILISALAEYGDPNAGLYRHLRTSTYLPVFLQHLKILVRGVGRVGTIDDIELLEQIGQADFQLSRIDSTPDNHRALTRAMEWIDNVTRSISTDRGNSL